MRREWGKWEDEEIRVGRRERRGKERGRMIEKDNEKIDHIAQYVQSMLTYHCMKAAGTIHSIA